MKLIYIFTIIGCMSLLLEGCKENEGRVVFPYSSPEISNVSYSVTDQAKAADSIYFSLDIKDTQTPLSTLEVTLALGEKKLYSKSIRTAGYAAQIKDHGIYIPFYADMEEGEAVLTLKAVNVEGSEKTEVKTFTVKRPQLPETIFLHYGDNKIRMNRSAENPYEYVTEGDSYPESFSGKISTDESLEGSELIWGISETKNKAELVSATEAGFTFDYTNWQIEKIIFNTFVFELTIEGYSKNMKVNDVDLNPVDGYFYASVQFEQGEEVEVSGFEDMEGAYNRDFFTYNSTTRKLTFLRESGKWQVYYSVTYNYMWVARMDDVAPAAFWLIGHGFTCAPVWNDDYSSGGWSLEDISGMAYAVKIAENKYQSTVYLSNKHAEGNFDIQFYAKREWVASDEMAVFNDTSFTGDNQNVRFAGGDNADVCSTDGFVPGYFRLILDITEGLDKAKLDFKRLTNE